MIVEPQWLSLKTEHERRATFDHHCRGGLSIRINGGNRRIVGVAAANIAAVVAVVATSKK
jgi:hypothetical protein